jgi:hypothetical protein
MPSHERNSNPTAAETMRLNWAPTGDLVVFQPGQYFLDPTVAWDWYTIAHMRNGLPETPGVAMTDPGPPVGSLLPQAPQ